MTLTRPFPRPPAACLALLLLFTAAAAMAAGAPPATAPWYQFEIILFERIAPGAGATEAWPDDPGTPSRLDALPLRIRPPKTGGDPAKPIPYATLPRSAWRLTGLEQRLKRSRNYHPLLHLAWRQPVVDPKRAQRLYLELPQGQGSRVGVGLTTQPKLEGTLSVGVKRYLHLRLDLLLRRLVMGDATGPGAGLGPHYQPYRLQARRRLRSGELHYIDHPILGVLFLASKYQPPKPALEPAPPVSEPPAGSPAQAGPAKKPSQSSPQR